MRTFTEVRPNRRILPVSSELILVLDWTRKSMALETKSFGVTLAELWLEGATSWEYSICREDGDVVATLEESISGVSLSQAKSLAKVWAKEFFCELARFLS